MWLRDSAEEVILEHVGPNRDQRVAIAAGTRFVVDAVSLRKFFYVLQPFIDLTTTCCT